MNNDKPYGTRDRADKCTLNTEQKYSFNLTQKSLLDGIIMSEILGEPKAKKGLVLYNVHKSTNSR
ncbi:hypothetical protein [Proteiniborus sp. MB09-C3]|uniref:hypothetical protein n=1 Tax=Proteiniborus sp. MB09-C3 TaxID=3050072 RepID=UPI0025562E32|nr:hypothetical protein [Proteiniborus sp. MB09-C3]WIV10672.1 hypothetical protein QO263_10940 [Proteiniborus sp. MB09-C3]